SCIGVADLMLGNAPAATSAMGEQDLREAVTQFKRQFILSALERNRWNQTRTAHKLNIQRTYLSRLIKELNILQTKE
ncbi:MAG: helix-turn-helix domain-containing protein, partial [Rectinemataceae bacterium]